MPYESRAPTCPSARNRRDPRVSPSEGRRYKSRRHVSNRLADPAARAAIPLRRTADREQSQISGSKRWPGWSFVGARVRAGRSRPPGL
jgi:hypothetical protein